MGSSYPRVKVVKIQLVAWSNSVFWNRMWLPESRDKHSNTEALGVRLTSQKKSVENVSVLHTHVSMVSYSFMRVGCGESDEVSPV